VLANDFDADGDALTAMRIQNVQHGLLQFNANGTFSYTPDDDFNGTDSFTYIVNDGLANSAEATVTFTVTPKEDPPTATDDIVFADEDTPLAHGGMASIGPQARAVV
jgi:VCBS repeat-containing protein